MNKIKKNKIFKLVYELFKSIITLGIIILILVIVIQRVSNNKISVAGFRIFNVATESMVPKYLVGDILVVKTVDASTLNIGDDITYQGREGSFADKIVTHQLIDIETNKDGTKSYHTKGIANSAEDPEITAEQIYGIVVTKLALLTYVSRIINNMWVMYAILIVSIALVMILDVKDLKKNEEEEISKIDKENDENDKKEPKKKVNKMRERRRKRQNNSK